MTSENPDESIAQKRLTRWGSLSALKQGKQRINFQCIPISKITLKKNCNKYVIQGFTIVRATIM